MTDLEDFEFRRMLIASVVVHLVAVASLIVTTSLGWGRRYVEVATPGGLSVMWARPIGSPRKTAPDKLPAPIVQPEAIAPEEKPRVVMPEDVRNLTKHSPVKESEDEARRKAMAEALAGVHRDVERRPMPNPDNFPSDKGAGTGGTAGLEGGGIAGALGGDPAFSRYRDEIRRIITENLIWLQQRSQLRAAVTFRIDAQGAILDAELSKSSGDSAFDRAALRAVSKSSPLPAPPADLARTIVREQFVINFTREKK